ncbi:hypothetical protein [Croceibacterium salegens]|nr:hypothetical protein [Croceibacterium salegens]
MVKALWHEQAGSMQGDRDHVIDWTKRMSDHIAAALLVYTGLHIFVTMQALNGHHGSILPYFGLVFLVAAIIPACRLFEKRWERLAASGESDGELRRLFNRDLVVLWLAAIGLPLVITALVKGVLALL